jgi:hypothetical protein
MGMGKSKDLEKDVKKLRKELRKYGKKYGDEGTYKERDEKHIVIEFYINGKLFSISFGKTPSSWSGVKNLFGIVRNSLLSCEIEKKDLPDFSKVRMITDFEREEREELEDEIFRLIEKYEGEEEDE